MENWNTDSSPLADEDHSTTCKIIAAPMTEGATLSIGYTTEVEILMGFINQMT